MFANQREDLHKSTCAQDERIPIAEKKATVQRAASFGFENIV
jgi:hypothetical protein